MVPRVRPWQADLALLGVAAVWGATFVTVKRATLTLPVLPFLAVRFALAGAVLALAFPSAWRQFRAPLIARGVGIGAFLFLGYLLQTWGLQYTTAGRAGFITGLSVVLVPLGQGALWRRPPGRQAVAGVALATAGLAAMGWEAGELGRGDVLVLGCALAFAAHILSVAAWAGDAHPVPITAVQVLTVALASALAALLPGACPSGWSWHLLGPSVLRVWDALLLTGLFATAVAFLVQNAVQRFTEPTHTALIFSAEPVFATVFAWLLGGETLTPRGLLGGALVVLGMLAAQLPAGPGKGPRPGARSPVPPGHLRPGLRDGCQRGSGPP
ncbi:MAG: DMT family transporter [Bacillota bacterium]